ncbi:MAG: hypothetical protein JSU09_00260 [Bacteroidetes bacterium]|nr:hypothetical protein [Bacteroidota bacterium]
MSLVSLVCFSLGVVLLFFIWKKVRNFKFQAILQSNKQVDEKRRVQYEEYRKKALEMTATQLGVEDESGTVIIYGVVIDWWELGEIATVVSFWSGDSSVYYGTGPFIDSGPKHDNVFAAATEVVSLAYNYLNNVSLCEKTPLAKQGDVTFYFMTNKGKFCASEGIQSIKNEKSIWGDLYHASKRLVVELWR